MTIPVTDARIPRTVGRYGEFAVFGSTSGTASPVPPAGVSGVAAPPPDGAVGAAASWSQLPPIVTSLPLSLTTCPDAALPPDVLSLVSLFPLDPVCVLTVPITMSLEQLRTMLETSVQSNVLFDPGPVLVMDIVPLHVAALAAVPKNAVLITAALMIFANFFIASSFH